MSFKPTHVSVHYRLWTVCSSGFVLIKQKLSFRREKVGKYKWYVCPIPYHLIALVDVTFHLILQRHHGQFHRGRGGRVEELEGPAVMVDEFRSYSETKERAFSRAGEEIFHQYDHKLKETEASHCVHFVICIIKVSTPAGSI